MPKPSAKKRPDSPARHPRYRLGRRIGLGGMAEVFLAEAVGDGASCREVAVKRALPGRLERSPEFEAMFIEEARLSGLLSHPNVVAVLDFGRGEDGIPFLVMEYVDGVTLADLARTGPLPYPLAIFVVSEVLSGLAHAHVLPRAGRVRGMVHRDVTPHNVLLSSEGAVKIADFGIAKAFEGASASASEVTKGTQGYSSPEQLNGLPLDGRSDLFAVGVVLWELLACRRLFMGSPGEVVTQTLFRDIRRPSAHRRGVPADLEAVAMRLLSRDLAARYRTAEEAASELARCLDAPRDGRRELQRVLSERFERDRGARGCWKVRPDFRPEPPQTAPRPATATAPQDEVPAPEPDRLDAVGVRDEPPAATPQEVQPFTFDEYIELVGAMERSPRLGRSRNLVLVHLLFHLGLSPEILSGLDLEQLDLESRTFVDLDAMDGVEPRTVPFNDLVTEALERYVEDRRALVRRADLPALFLTKRCRRITVRGVQELVRHHIG
jgi:serine/threonine protein kinase